MKPLGKKQAKRKPKAKPGCGLCGNTEQLTKTPCCNHWICDDLEQYELFSFANTSCYRNHERYTLCSYHYCEDHEGNWQDCQDCREEFDTEIYVYQGTNEFNFEVLKNPPAYEPTHCKGCNRIIHLGDGGYTLASGNYFCMKCKSFPT